MKATPTHERPKVINLTDFNQNIAFNFAYYNLFIIFV